LRDRGLNLAESRHILSVLDQDALHFLNRFWIALHRMSRVHNLLRFHAVDMRARIFYDSVSSLCRRPLAFNRTDTCSKQLIAIRKKRYRE
jgi:hypothetical protein